MLIEGVMAIQRHIDEEGMPPTDSNGRRVPLGCYRLADPFGEALNPCDLGSAKDSKVV